LLPACGTPEGAGTARNTKDFGSRPSDFTVALRLVAPPHTHSGRRRMPVAEGHTTPDHARTRRQRDRRRALGDVVAMLARVVAGRADSGNLRSTFETALLRVLPVRSIVLRDQASRWPADKARDDEESVAFEVAGPTPAQRGLLQATFERAARLGEWDFQVLGQAAQLGALVLEIERGRSQSGRSPASAAVRPRRDGAAPLIGSTPAMAALRDRIERVANTDFTVLLEGETRRELANSL